MNRHTRFITTTITVILALPILVRCGKDSPTKPQPPQAPARITATQDSGSATLTVSAGTSASDRLALTALYNATNGSNWTNNTNWLSELPMGQWHGVTTDENGRVTELRLTQNNLEGPIPTELGNLEKLETLSFWINKLSGVIPRELGKLSNLGTLWLATNNLSGTIPEELGRLVKMWQMSFASNPGLSGTLPLTFTNLTALNYLYLSGTGMCAPMNPDMEAWLNTIEEHDVSTCADPADLASDKAALIALYNATNGPNWTNKENWLSDAPLSEWSGITTNNEGRVTRVEMNRNNLQGSIPSAIGQLDMLQDLSLESNKLAGNLPNELGQIKTLTRLAIAYNQFTGSIPFHIIGELTNLRVLGLQGNQFTGSIPSELGQLGNLTWLSLGDNRLSGMVPAQLGRLSNLRSLSLAGNQLSGAIPAELGRLSNLTRLNLSSNPDLSGTLPLTFTNLTALNYLRLWGTGVCAPASPEMQAWLSTIEEHDVASCADPADLESDKAALIALYNSTNGPNWTNNSNWLSESPLGNWHGVTTDGSGRVTELRLDQNNLEGPIPTELGSLDRLQFLHLWNNELHGAVPPELGKLSNLGTLWLASNNLSGTIPDELGGLVKLRQMSFADNPDLSGTLPLTFTNLSLETLWVHDTNICAPSNIEMKAWLSTIQNHDVTTNCSDLDVEALTVFYNSTDGPNWTNNENWLSDAPLNDWFGVTTDEIGRVEGLELPSNNLSGAVPPEIADLTNLRDLNLSLNNELIGPLPLRLTTLSLESMNFKGTHVCATRDTDFQDWLSVIPNQSVAHCVELDTHALFALVGLYNATDGKDWTNNENWLSQAPLGAWYGVSTDVDGRVTELDLSDNNLSGSLPSSLSKLEDLKNLNLEGNSGLLGPLPESLTGLSVESLNLKGTGLCAPSTSGFQTWLIGIGGSSVVDVCTDAHPDWEVLVTLYNENNGPNWEDNTNWLSEEPLGEWFGVSTDADGRVTALNLRQNNLLGALPEELGRLDKLELLNLPFNEISGSIPPELGNLGNLRSLDLAFCWISGTIPPEIGKLAKLESLNLTRNGSTLAGPLPPELGQLTNLNLLALGGNGFSGSIPRSIGRLTKLRELFLWGNGFTGFIPKEIGLLAELSFVEISYTQLSGSLPVELGQITNLKTLWLNNNKLTGSIPAQIGQMSGLTDLRLSNNELTGVIPGELSRMTSLESLDLTNNQLSGSVPPELGKTPALKVLALAGNTELVGSLPIELTQLELESLMLGDTGLCAPRNAEFQNWLELVENSRVASCAVPLEATAYLTQASQSLDHPVPLVAGEDALLRVFLKSGEDIEVPMPPVRASFYQGGGVVYVADAPGEASDVPSTFDEETLTATGNLRVPGAIVTPGMEVVIEIDPDRTLDSNLAIAGRIPETGRIALDVRELPTFDLTLIPYLWVDGPDLTVLSAIDGITPESDLMRPTRDLLPVNDFQLTVHPPVWTSVDPVSDNVGVLGPELEVIYALEGETGYYMGIFRLAGPMGGLLGIAAGIPSYLSFSILDPNVIAHEIGHNLNLFHAPCGGAGGPDPFYPYDDGSIGVTGYDMMNESLVSPQTWDLMSYCEPMWISDYSFTRALVHRMRLGEVIPPAIAAASKGLLLWGGLDEYGELTLEPAFVVNAPPKLPDKGGPYTIAGVREDGSNLFSLSFAIPEYADAEGGSFAFVLPVRADWPGSLNRITLTGPEGFAELGEAHDRHYALMRDEATGEVRGILRDWPDPSDSSVAGRRIAPEPGMEITVSGGIPDQDSW